MQFRAKYLGFFLIAIAVLVAIQESDAVRTFIVSKLRPDQQDAGSLYDDEFESKCAEFSKLAHQALTYLPGEYERCGDVLEQMTEVLDKTPVIERKEFSSRRRQMKTMIGFLGYACVEISRTHSFEKSIERREAPPATPETNADPDAAKEDEGRVKEELEVLKSQIASSQKSTQRAIADSEFMLGKIDSGLKLKQ